MTTHSFDRLLIDLSPVGLTLNRCECVCILWNNQQLIFEEDAANRKPDRFPSFVSNHSFLILHKYLKNWDNFLKQAWLPPVSWQSLIGLVQDSPPRQETRFASVLPSLILTIAEVHRKRLIFIGYLSSPSTLVFWAGDMATKRCPRVSYSCSGTDAWRIRPNRFFFWAAARQLAWGHRYAERPIPLSNCTCREG